MTLTPSLRGMLTNLDLLEVQVASIVRGPHLPLLTAMDISELHRRLDDAEAIRVVVIDDHPVFRAALAHLRRTRDDIEVLAESAVADPGVADLVTVH